jgi:hypothetical protein
MKILTTRKTVIYSLALCFFIGYLNAQNQTNSIKQDPKFEQLLNEKRKINTSLTTNDRYKVQIFSGTSEIAKKTMTEFRLEFKNTDATIIFNTPNYKVWVGNYKTHIEAERNLIEIKKKYKTVFLIKPNK